MSGTRGWKQKIRDQKVWGIVEERGDLGNSLRTYGGMRFCNHTMTTPRIMKLTEPILRIAAVRSAAIKRVDQGNLLPHITEISLEQKLWHYSFIICLKT